MRLEIKKIGIDGDGIGYLNRCPVFVKGALEGETVDVHITADKGKYKLAEIDRIVTASKERNHKLCSCYKLCGGCSILHASYSEQLKIKKNLLKQSLIKYADIDADFEIEPSPSVYNYRNSIKLPFCDSKGKICNALYQEETNHFIIFDECYNHEEILEDIRKQILDICNQYHLHSYDRHSKLGLRYLYMRHLNDAVQVCIVTGNDTLNKDFIYKVSKIDNVVSLYQNINTSKSGLNIFGKQMIHLAGSTSLRCSVNGIKANLSLRSFYQMNSGQAENIYNYVVDSIDDKQKLVVEAYCGIGIMSLQLAKKAQQVVGIEIIPEAVNNAENNARNNNIENVKFVCGDSAEMMKKMFRHRQIDTLIVDPPRGGLDDEMLIAMLKADIRNIIYVSCNHVTLAQNIDVLSDKYSVKGIKAFDMFPNTTHVETVVLLNNNS